MKSTLLWITAIILTIVTAYFQRMTGPTYPLSGRKTVGTAVVSYDLIRSGNTGTPAAIRILAPDSTVSGLIRYRRYKSFDSWTTAPMQRSGDTLTASLPSLPPAGKMMYYISIQQGRSVIVLNQKPAVLRYKGAVPGVVLILHIIFINFAMLLSARAGLEALFRGKRIYIYTWMTVILLFLGGLVFGPIVQKYAFGAYWTGWPFGNDLTDNKSLVAFLFWIVALAVLFKNRNRRTWTLIAAIVTLVVFLIPHSLLGSEIDYTKTPQNTESSTTQP